MQIPLGSLKDKKMISSDAYEVGEIIDIRYDPFERNVVGLRIRTKRSEMLAAGSRKTTLLILPENFILNDVLLLNRPIEALKDAVSPDNDNIASLSSLISSKVVTKDNQLVGTVTTVMINIDTWKVSSLVIRLDKGAIEAMKMKKGFFSKINAEIGTEMILSSSDMIHLNGNMDDIRERMTIVE
ncbi:MAG: PRC-barrel domain-containing protein [Methanomassiliicoccaceae archaeon]|nr:PRC-barrel domain-containing protein [Methanomassiliicoccaceae archaeon]